MLACVALHVQCVEYSSSPSTIQVQLWTLVGQLTHDSLYQPSEEGTNGTMTSPKGTAQGPTHNT